MACISIKKRGLKKTSLALAFATMIFPWAAQAVSAGGVLAPSGPGVFIIGGCIYGTCTQDGGIAYQADMISGFNSVGSTVQNVGSMLAAGQIAQESALMQTMQQVRNTIKNSAKDSINATLGAQMVQSTPLGYVNGQVVPIRLGGCHMTSPTGVAGGAMVGSISKTLNGSIIAGNLGQYNSGAAGNVSTYTRIMAGLTPNDRRASTVLGGIGGLSSPITYTPGRVSKYIAAVINATPLPALNAAAKSTVGGQNYEAIRHQDLADVGLSEETLNGISQMNAPLFPLQTWAIKKVNGMQGSAALKTQLSKLVSGNGSNGKISEDTFLYVMNMMRFGNPTWWKTVDSSSNSLYLTQQATEINAMRLHMAYMKMILLERLAALLAENQSTTTRAAMNTGAMSVRNAALASEIAK